jgi:hydroxyacylglutathione hydrolase
MKSHYFRYLIILALISRGLLIQGQVKSSWFNIKEAGKGLWIIDDHKSANCYLVEGKDSALLIDTGIGAADLAGTVSQLTSKPVIVVNTHGHSDHAGANYQFDKVYIHKADLEAARMVSLAKQGQTDGGATRQGEKPSPEEVYKGKIKNPVLIAISDGYTFNLGGKHIQVMETPGHTPGSICLLDVENKLLFSGDNNNNLVWLFLKGCLPLSSYLKTLEKEATRLNEFTTLYPGHNEAMPNIFVNDQVKCVKSILDGTCTPKTYDSFAGKAMICAWGNAQVAYDPGNL